MSGLPSDLVVVVTGAGGGAGNATVARLLADGATVIAADRDAGLLAPPPESDRSRWHPATVDLLDAAATRTWADSLTAEHSHVDGVVHLVGGWRGGRTFADNSLDDWALLHDLLVRTVQHTTLAFHDALVASPHGGRFVLVSAQAAASPSAGGAGYAAAKAAAEAWTLALADSFAKAVGGPAGESGPPAAAVVLVVKALLTPAMREAKPDATFAGFTTVEDLAEAIGTLLTTDAVAVNGTRQPA
jgi:NADP-dependent 3-hydroxy acid dehydrogenase YdfG